MAENKNLKFEDIWQYFLEAAAYAILSAMGKQRQGTVKKKEFKFEY